MKSGQIRVPILDYILRKSKNKFFSYLLVDQSVPVTSLHPCLSGISFSGVTKVSLYGRIGNGPILHPQLLQPNVEPTSLKVISTQEFSNSREKSD